MITICSKSILSVYTVGRSIKVKLAAALELQEIRVQAIRLIVALVESIHLPAEAWIHILGMRLIAIMFDGRRLIVQIV